MCHFGAGESTGCGCEIHPFRVFEVIWLIRVHTGALGIPPRPADSGCESNLREATGYDMGENPGVRNGF